VTNKISYEDENTFEASEDNDENLKDAIYKVINVIAKKNYQFIIVIIIANCLIY
jgi:hypothetical protein